MGKTGEMISELEEDLKEARAIDARIKIWEQMFNLASDDEKKKMMVIALKSLMGLSDEEIKKIIK